MRTYSCWATVTGKIFVDALEIEERLKEKYPDLLTKEDIEEDDVSYLDKCTAEQEKECFREIAQQKLSDMFPSDDPFKFNECELDLTSFRY